MAEKYFVLESSTKRGYSWEGGQDPFDTLQEALDEANSRWSHLTRDEIAKLDEFIVVSGTVDDDDECIGNIIEVHYSFFVKGM